MIPLVIQLSLVPTLGLPAVLVTFSFAPAYVPTVFAALVGAHFLPYVWLQRTSIYAVLAAVVSLGPFVLSVIMREGAFPWVGILVGLTLIIGAFLVRSHASRLTDVGQ
jgi:hypothetical protein